MKKSEWFQKGKKLFGENMMEWKFICPSCGNVASVLDYKNAGAPSGAIGFSCVGLWLPEQKEAFSKKPLGIPCNYSGGGLININPIEVDGRKYFDFAPLSNNLEINQ